ncbi:hypothetical protein Ddc_13132 [Ditylenchus destructor]|nr:hypothetical protein Ddc_13132 [Ditylenchus destructor]
MDGEKRQISLSKETLADILRYLSRKELFQHFYFVNRNIWQIASSQHFVPNVQLIQELYIDTTNGRHCYSHVCDVQEYVKDYNPDNNSGFGNLIRIKSSINSKCHNFPVMYFVKEMPIPKPFVRFRQVWIEHCADEFLIEFLRDTHESFLDCNLKFEFCRNSIGTDVQNKLAYLLSNVFIKPARILINVYCALVHHQILQTKGLSNCNKLEIQFEFAKHKVARKFHCALLNWLQNEEHELVPSESKLLVLNNYPRKMILNMVQYLKQAFKDENSHPSAFLITFRLSHANDLAPYLKGEHRFSLNKISTGEKLSFFTTTAQTPDIYRLWRRKVISESWDLEMEEQYKRTNIHTSV